MKRSLNTLAAVLTTAALASAPAWAQYGAASEQQDMQDPAVQGQAAPQQQEFTDDELKRFNEARSAVEEVRDEYAGKLQGVQDAGEARELQTEASEKMAEEVRDAGLDVETYNAIAMAMRTDPELRKKLLDSDS